LTDYGIHWENWALDDCLTAYLTGCNIDGYDGAAYVRNYASKNVHHQQFNSHVRSVEMMNIEMFSLLDKIETAVKKQG
jgi:hypothetical protein